MSTIPIPPHLRFRDEEWAKLTRFARHGNGALRIGVVSGRRRLGKSHLLRALCEENSGTYLLAVQEDSRPAAQARVVEAVARARGLPAESLRLGDDWAAILRLLLQPRPGNEEASPLLVLDEFPYLLRHSPELPGLLQSLYDETRYESSAGRETLHGGIILCGSALSVMHELLSGQQALRGRATLDLRLTPLGFRAARRFWNIEDLHTAFLVDAACGGIPGYQVLAEHDAPQNPADFDAFAAGGLLAPGHPLYSRTETEYLLREDPRLDQRATYYPLLSAMVSGATTPTEIGARIGKERSTTAHALEVLEAAGYAQRDQDLLKKRSPSYLVPDPMIRFNQAVTIPQTPSSTPAGTNEPGNRHAPPSSPRSSAHTSNTWHASGHVAGRRTKYPASTSAGSAARRSPTPPHAPSTKWTSLSSAPANPPSGPPHHPAARRGQGHHCTARRQGPRTPRTHPRPARPPGTPHRRRRPCALLPPRLLARPGSPRRPPRRRPPDQPARALQPPPRVIQQRPITQWSIRRSPAKPQAVPLHPSHEPG